jgi:acetyl esterase
MPIHPQLKALVDSFAAMELPPRSEMSPDQARQRAVLIGQQIGPGPDMASVDAVLIDGPRGPIPARAYHPITETCRGAIVYLHGGGWVVGGLDEFDTVMRMLAHEAECTLLGVDYRLAPEHRFPAGAEDAYAATRWAGEHLDRGAGLAVVGDSSGGNLAAVTALKARDDAWGGITLQVLVYPVTDHDFETSSYQEHGASGLPLGRVDMEWFWDHYLPDVTGRDDPRASPLRAIDLSGLPSTAVLVAEYDPLRDDGLAYAARLATAGVPVITHRYDDMAHGFFTMVHLLDTGRLAVTEVAYLVNEALQ